jgi:hypothetical protein
MIKLSPDVCHTQLAVDAGAEDGDAESAVRTCGVHRSMPAMDLGTIVA